MSDTTATNLNKILTYLMGGGIATSVSTALAGAKDDIQVWVLILTGVVCIIKGYTMWDKNKREKERHKKEMEKYG